MMHDVNDTVVFLGPSLAVEQARRILPARYEPPARFSSIYQLIGSEVKTILLIDGVFHSQPSVWQRELDAAMASGVTVFGASSMGALRAAELSLFGMIGHGEVFNWYQQNEIDGDDEVALLHGDEESGYRGMSEPMVNIRYTLREAHAAGLIGESELNDVLAIVKQTFYPQRTYERLVADLETSGTLSHLAKPLADYFNKSRVNIKQRDAVSLLNHVSELRRNGASAGESGAVAPFALRVRHGPIEIFDKWYMEGLGHRRLEHEGRWWSLKEHSALLESKTDVQIPNLGGSGHIALSAGACQQLVFDRALRETARRYAMRQQLDVPDEYMTAVRARMQAAIAQTSRDTASWLQACRVTRPELELRLADEALVAWFSARLPPGVDAVDTLPAPVVNDGQIADPGLYLRVFSTDQERRACQYVCLNALLERESLTLQSFDSLTAAWEWAALRLVQESLEN